MEWDVEIGSVLETLYSGFVFTFHNKETQDPLNTPEHITESL
jgi:hypothetical protein